MPGVSNANNTVQNATLTSATEVVAAVSIAESIGVPQGNVQGLRIRGKLNVTGASGTTGYTIKCRQGATTSGAAVSPTTGDVHSASASESQNIYFDFLDTAPVNGVQIYCVTVNAAGATATLNSVVIGVEEASQYTVGE